jgi:hypothetical protein
MSESASGPFAFVKRIDHFKLALHHRHYNQLRNPVSGLDFKGSVATIPAGDFHFSLVVTVDEANQIPEDDPMFVAKAGSWQ